MCLATCKNGFLADRRPIIGPDVVMFVKALGKGKCLMLLEFAQQYIILIFFFNKHIAYFLVKLTLGSIDINFENNKDLIGKLLIINFKFVFRQKLFLHSITQDAKSEVGRQVFIVLYFMLCELFKLLKYSSCTHTLFGVSLC